MRRVLAGALLASVLTACSVEAPEYRPAPTAAAVSTAVAKADILPLTYEVSPLEVRPGTVVSVSKTAIFFSNPNSFVLDWFMTVRFRSADGLAVTDERIGSAGKALGLHHRGQHAYPRQQAAVERHCSTMTLCQQ